MRGRRLALLLAGALPLLAQNDIPLGDDDDKVEWHEDEHDQQHAPESGAAEALHDDSLSSLPALPVGLMENGKEQIKEATASDTIEEMWERERESTRAMQGELSGNNSQSEEIPEPEPGSSEPLTGEVDMPENANKSQEEHSTENTDDSSQSGDIHAEERDIVEADEEDTQIDPAEEPAAADDHSKEDKEEKVERLVVDYASKSAGALILEKSPSMKGTSNLLNADKDKYAIAPCEDKMFVVIGLSEDILVKHVRLSNYERYSSQVKDFQIEGSQDMQTWADLGTYQALLGSRDQSFDLVEPSWARYLKFKFLSHHGSEHYCTVSQIQVHGSTMLQGFKEQWEEESDADSLETHSDSENESQPHDGDNSIEEQHANLSTDETLHTDQDSGEENLSTSGAETQTYAETTEEEAELPIVETPQEDTINSENSLDSKVDGNDNATDDDIPELADNRDYEATEPESMSDATTEPVTTEENVGQIKPGDTLEESRAAEKDQTHGRDKKESMDFKNQNKTALPDALLDFHFNEEKSDTLSVASIGVSSHKPANRERTCAAEALDIFSITSPAVTEYTQSAVEDIESEPSLPDTAWVVHDATAELVRELQDKIRTRLERNPVGAVISRLSAVSGPAGESVETEREAAQSSEGDDDEYQSKNGGISNDAPSSLDVAEKEDETAAEVKSAIAREAPAVEATIILDVYSVDGVNEKLSSILSHFPSAKCLTGMDYHQFKARIVSAASGANGAAAGGAGRMEPIFKTLTNEIKALQTNLSANDQFTTALVSCYQQVLVEVYTEMDRLHQRQEARLSALEISVRELLAERERSLLRVVAPTLVGIVTLSAQWIAGAIQNTFLFIYTRLPLQSLWRWLLSAVTMLCRKSVEVCNRHFETMWKKQVNLCLIGIFAVAFIAVILLQMAGRNHSSGNLEKDTRVKDEVRESDTKSKDISSMLEPTISETVNAIVTTAEEPSRAAPNVIEADAASVKSSKNTEPQLITEGEIAQKQHEAMTIVGSDVLHREGENEGIQCVGSSLRPKDANATQRERDFPLAVPKVITVE